MLEPCQKEIYGEIQRHGMFGQSGSEAVWSACRPEPVVLSCHLGLEGLLVSGKLPLRP